MRPQIDRIPLLPHAKNHVKPKTPGRKTSQPLKTTPNSLFLHVPAPAYPPKAMHGGGLVIASPPAVVKVFTDNCFRELSTGGGSPLGIFSFHKSRGSRMRRVSRRSSMKLMSLISASHLGHFKGSTSQTLFMHSPVRFVFVMMFAHAKKKRHRAINPGAAIKSGWRKP